MERAEALQVAPGLLQPQVFGHQVHEIQPVLDLLDRVLLHRGHRRQLTRYLPPGRLSAPLGLAVEEGVEGCLPGPQWSEPHGRPS